MDKKEYIKEVDKFINNIKSELTLMIDEQFEMNLSEREEGIIETAILYCLTRKEKSRIVDSAEKAHEFLHRCDFKLLELLSGTTIESDEEFEKAINIIQRNAK